MGNTSSEPACPEERGADAKPVTMGFWMEGKLLHTMPVETKPSKLVYFNPFAWEEARLYLPEGDHTFHVGFINDEFVKDLSPKEAYDGKKNKFLESMIFVGPFPSNVESRAAREFSSATRTPAQDASKRSLPHSPVVRTAQ